MRVTAASRGHAGTGTRQKRFTAAGLPIPRVPLGATRTLSNTGFAAPPGNSAECVKEVQGPELRHQRVPSADQQGRTPSFSNRLNNHPQDQSIEENDGELG